MLWGPSGEGLGRQKGEVETLANLTKASLGLGGCTSIERPVAQASTCTAFGFADAQVDLALAEIEKGFSLHSTVRERE